MFYCITSKITFKSTFQSVLFVKVNMRVVNTWISSQEKRELFTPVLIPSAAGSSSSSAFFSRVGLHYSTHRSQAPCDGVSSVHVAYFSSGHILPQTPPAHKKRSLYDSCNKILQHFQYFPACKHLMALLFTSS